MDQAIVDLAFAEMMLERARRVVYCRPEHVDEVRALIDAHLMGGLVEVRPSPFLPDGTAAIIVDEKPLEAALDESLAALARRPWGGT